MTMKSTVLLLYPAVNDQTAGQALKHALHEQKIPVAELVIGNHYAEVLDRLEAAVIPVVMHE